MDFRTLKKGRSTEVIFPKESVKNKNCLLVHTTRTNRGIIQLLLAENALDEAGASRITTFLGYMGYARGHENYLVGKNAQVAIAQKLF